MAAIWGVVEKEHSVAKKNISDMCSSMQEFKIDRYEEIVQKNFYFACGHQYFTEEAKVDISPYYDREAGIIFLADCYLYNREELLQELLQNDVGYKEEELKETGDAMLAYRAYILWGERFVEKLKGSFAFAVYKIEEEQLLLYTDHLAQRYLAYYIDEEAICFSTGYQPILAFLGKEKIGLNKEWIAAAYTDCTADTLRIPGRTVYEKVYHVEPGCYIKVDRGAGTVESVSYWNPLYSKKKLPKLSDDGYKELFLSTFSKTVNRMLRARGETGISLSGGLDSSTVAAFAAQELEKKGKKLFGYTSVPANDFEYCNDRFHMENEKELVLEQQKMYSNIVPCFVDVSEMNCFSNLEDYAGLYRKPVKPVLNMIYLEGIRLEAEKDGCSILLSGQNGNATISYGSILTYLYQKYLSGHFIMAYKEAKAFCRFRRVSRKKLLQVFLKSVREEKFTKLTFGDDCLLKSEDIEKYRLLKKMQKIKKTQGTGFVDSKKQRRGFCFMPLVFQHMGFFDTYTSLKYGVLPLDPTLTKDMIELCMVLPIDCYVRGGKERRAIRDYMKGYVPDKILNNQVGRGVQAADYAHRVNRDWDKVKEKIYELLEDPILCRYLDADKLRKLVEEAKKKEYAMDKNLVARLAVVSSLGYFLKQFYQ